MDDYKKLAEIYEGYLGMSYDGPTKSYPTNSAPHGYSYRKGQLPVGQEVSGGDRMYDAGMAGQGITIPVSDEEEVKSPIIDKISEYMQQAVDDEMQYAVYILGELKQFVSSYLDKQD